MIKNKSKYITLASSILILVTVLLSCDTSFNTVVKDFFYSEKVTIKVDGDGVASTDLIGYKLTKSAYDFGYCTSETTKTLTFTAAEAFSISPTITGSNKFTAGSPSKSYVVKGEQFSIDVIYTPSGTTWDEANLSLSSGNEDAYKITLIGSSFKQPKNVGSSGSLRLWLRADMIRATDIINETEYIKNLNDYSGNSFKAVPSNYSKAPFYEANGINGLPSIKYTGNQFLVVDGTTDNPIVNDANGTTTFVVFHTPSKGTYSIINAWNGSRKVFPGVAEYYRYCNKDDGYSTSPTYCLAVYGYGYGGEYRFIFDDATGDNKYLEELNVGGNYSMCMKFTSNPSGTNQANTEVWQNSIKKFINYTYSCSSSTLYYSGAPYCSGSYGKPISNGAGSRYGDLGDSAVNITAGSAWDNARLNHSTRPNDFAYSYTPYNTSSSASGATYFTNRIYDSSTNDYNKTIKTIYIGPDLNLSTTFVGQIAEVMVYNEALSDDEIKAVNNYIYYRYNIGSEQ